MHQNLKTFGRGKVRALASLILAFTLSGCDNIYRYLKCGEVGWALKKELRDNHNKEVNIAKLTSFEWDEFYLFGPYEPTEDICKSLRIVQTECHSIITSESTDDGEMLMVFRHKGKVVHTEMHIRWHGDFTPVPNESFKPESAVFIVSIEGKGALGQEHLVLRQKTAKIKPLEERIR